MNAYDVTNASTRATTAAHLRVGELQTGDRQEDLAQGDDEVLRHHPEDVHVVLVDVFEDGLLRAAKHGSATLAAASTWWRELSNEELEQLFV